MSFILKILKPFTTIAVQYCWYAAISGVERCSHTACAEEEMFSQGCQHKLLLFQSVAWSPPFVRTELELERLRPRFPEVATGFGSFISGCPAWDTEGQVSIGEEHLPLPLDPRNEAPSKPEALPVSSLSLSPTSADY